MVDRRSQPMFDEFDDHAPGTLAWLQAWYATQCDGDWEHANGVSIESLDNPAGRYAWICTAQPLPTGGLPVARSTAASTTGSSPASLTTTSRPSAALSTSARPSTNSGSGWKAPHSSRLKRRPTLRASAHDAAGARSEEALLAHANQWMRSTTNALIIKQSRMPGDARIAACCCVGSLGPAPSGLRSGVSHGWQAARENDDEKLRLAPAGSGRRSA